jgi:hypothetical protein
LLKTGSIHSFGYCFNRLSVIPDGVSAILDYVTSVEPEVYAAGLLTSYMVGSYVHENFLESEEEEEEMSYYEAKDLLEGNDSEE